MKKIEAVIRPYMLDDVIGGLEELGIRRINTSEVTVRGDAVRSDVTHIDREPMVKIELVVPDDVERQVRHSIAAAVAAFALARKTAPDQACTITVLPVESHETPRDIFKRVAASKPA